MEKIFDNDEQEFKKYCFEFFEENKDDLIQIEENKLNKILNCSKKSKISDLNDILKNLIDHIKKILLNYKKFTPNNFYSDLNNICVKAINTYFNILIDEEKIIKITNNNITHLCEIIKITEDLLEQLKYINESKILYLKDEIEKISSFITNSITSIVNIILEILNAKFKDMLDLNRNINNDFVQESLYVKEINSIISKIFNSSLYDLPKKYFIFTCNRFIIQFFSVFFKNIKKLKQISILGAHLLLIDLSRLKNNIKKIPTFHNELIYDNTEISKFSELVNDKTIKCELFLKVVSVDESVILTQYKDAIKTDH